MFRLSPFLASGLLASGQVTFFQDVLPVLEKHCQVCHRAGEIGPMPLLTYEQTRPWAKAIKTQVAERRMPPWFADASHSRFANDRTLSAADRETLSAWSEAGAPEGAKTAHKSREWNDGWNIEPDLILQMPDPIRIPATGTVEYTYLVIPTGFREDTWIAAAEVRPGNRAVVHHINAVIRPPASSWMRAAAPFTPYVPPPGSRDGQPDADDPQAGSLNVEFLSGYSPGMQAQRFDIDQSAKLIPAGSDIVLQLHYSPKGKPAEDQTRIGLVFAPGPPKNRFMTATVSGWNWEIPAGAANHVGHARMTFGEPVRLVSLQPHMHVRGKSMQVELTRPGGKPETVLSVPRYDFNWQIIYYLEKPLELPSGTAVEVSAHWDNSANNPRNPDPSKTVRWGNQSWDEMLSLPLGVLIPLN